MSVSPIHQNHPEPDVRVERITPDRAREYLGHNTRNRTIRARTVAAYSADMKNGDWRWNGEAIKFGADGTLLDGQHRLMAIVEADVPIRMLVVRGLPEETQMTMDTGAKRTFSDHLRLAGEDHYVTLATTARSVTAWEDGGVTAFASGNQYTNAQMLRTLDAYPWLRDGAPLISRVTHAARLPGTTAGLCWWLFTTLDSEDANHFFERLASDEGHRRGEPIYALRSLLYNSDDSVRSNRNKKYLAAVTIKAWNKYRDGEELRQLKFRAGGANPESFPLPH